MPIDLAAILAAFFFGSIVSCVATVVIVRRSKTSARAIAFRGIAREVQLAQKLTGASDMMDEATAAQADEQAALQTMAAAFSKMAGGRGASPQ